MPGSLVHRTSFIEYHMIVGTRGRVRIAFTSTRGPSKPRRGSQLVDIDTSVQGDLTPEIFDLASGVTMTKLESLAPGDPEAPFAARRSSGHHVPQQSRQQSTWALSGKPGRFTGS